ncbi:hypothetical protein ACQJBY_067214 [Aegilops geniculata]
MGEAGAPSAMPSWLELWNEWEIQVVVFVSFSLQVILFFFAGIRRYNISFVLKVLLWLVYLLADLAATYALGHMSSTLSKKSSGEHQLVAFWAPFLLLHLGGQDTITAYALEDNELWLRHLLNMFLQVAGTAYVLYKYIIAGGATFVRSAMLVLLAGFVKYGERIWALKCASKGSKVTSRPVLQPKGQARDCFTRNKQFGTYAFLVMAAHALRYVLVKPLVKDRNEASVDWSDTTIDLLNNHVQEYQWEDGEREDISAQEKRYSEEVYTAIEVELALMYDMLYTKAEVIHTRYGYCIRVISLVSCSVALVLFTKSKRDGYNTWDIVITFALLGGACALEVASVFKAIGSTWTYANLRGLGWNWLANAILFARYHLIIVKDGRWSSSVGQYNFISFCVLSTKTELKGRVSKWIGLQDLWNRAHYTKHAKLSLALKEFVSDLLKGKKRDMVQIEDVGIRRGYWARRLTGFHESKKLDWSLSFEFHKSVLIWHIATCAFLNDPAVKLELVNKDMAEAVNALSDYMMYVLVEHPDILPINAAARDLFRQTCACYAQDLSTYPQTANGPHQVILDYKNRRGGEIRKLYDNLTHPSWDDYPGVAVLVKACTLVHTMLEMKLGLTHKIIIMGTVWTEMLGYAATNASGEFHARQLSNGGEFLTHILLLTKYCAAIPPIEMPSEAANETVEASAAGHIELTVDNGCNDEITEIR